VVLFGAMGYVSIERQAARNRRRYGREAAYRDSQTEFEQTMQVMRDEHEAYELVKTRLERAISDSVVTVLNRTTQTTTSPL
jgi:hypothetical protein